MEKSKVESKGSKIIKILDENNIKYKQYKFKDCKNKQELPFDFYRIYQYLY
jgi:hypothetical protein